MLCSTNNGWVLNSEVHFAAWEPNCGIYKTYSAQQLAKTH